MKAEIIINKNNVISKIDERIYSSFIEHIGRAVYGGIYEPSHRSADENGFRQDVIDLVKQIGVPYVRYPGGNFVSGYNWEDGTGDRAKRPRRMELAWQSVETNEVGIDEFSQWAKKAGTEVMMAVNLGTRGPTEAQALVEYCNSDTDTYYAAKRCQNGFEKPFGIKLWCLGNEMDGPWQIGHKTADEYARVAHETGKIMKLTDPSIELIACGSATANMESVGEWEYTVLSECYDIADYIAIHSYYSDESESMSAEEFFSKSIEVENFIKRIGAVCDRVKEEKKSDKTVYISFDEWNVCDTMETHGNWRVAPPLLEQVYNLADALFVGLWINVFLRNSDRVKIACLAQLVNVIAPIVTENGGDAWVQTIFYPFMLASKYGRGSSLAAECICDSYDTEQYKNVPYLDVSSALLEDGKTVSVFIVNRSLTEEACIDIKAENFDRMKLREHTALEGDDLYAVNTKDVKNIVPVKKDTKGTIRLAAHSWNLLLFDVE